MNCITEHVSWRSSLNIGESPGPGERPPPPVVPIKANVFANDGSFFEQFKKMQEEQKSKLQEVYYFICYLELKVNNPKSVFYSIKQVWYSLFII